MSIFNSGEKATPASYINSGTNKKGMEELKHGFDAMGYEVPAFRKHNVDKCLKNIGVSSEDRFFIIKNASEHIADDNPQKAMDYIAKHVDTTGTYMVMSYFLTGEE